MKRHGNLWPQIVTFENLLAAARQAQRGKRFRPSTLEFNYHLESNLIALQRELQEQTYQPGEYHTFRIVDPKPRLISAAPYRDRVVHHALCNVIAPILDQTLIFDTYANRIGKGSHRALRRFTTYARSHRYILQCDIKKFFPSLDRTILKALLRHKIKCADTLWLIDTIIDASNPQEAVLDYFPGDDLLAPCLHAKGLPIGNLTSQLFANFYLAGCDRFIKETLHCRHYLRYVDDFALFADDRDDLLAAKDRIEAFLTALRLKLHPAKTQIFATAHGANFVGFRILPDRTRVQTDNLQRGRRRLRQLKQLLVTGEITAAALTSSQQSWQAHLAHGNTWRLCQKLFDPCEIGSIECERVKQSTSRQRQSEG